MNSRVLDFDSLKGLLVILVVLGHFLLGKVSENTGREIIYYFHMPLFLAINGYFLKASIDIKGNAKRIWRKFKRLSPPLIIAFVVYNFFYLQSLKYTNGISAELILKSLLSPYYHLWYVPAIILFSFYLSIIQVLSTSVRRVVLISFSILTIIYLGNDYEHKQWTPYNWQIEPRYFCYFIFFYFGHLVSHIKGRNRPDIYFLVFIGGTVIYGYSENMYISGASKLVALLALIKLSFSARSIFHNNANLLQIIGINAYPIYLWHVLPIIAIKSLDLSQQAYYAACLLTMSIFIYAIVKLHGRSHWLDYCFYGSYKSQNSVMHLKNRNL